MKIWWAQLLNATLWLGVGNAVVWGPLWWHWRVAPAEPTAQIIESDRYQPADDVLALVADTSMVTDHPLRGEPALTAARRLQQGQLALPNLPVIPVGTTFSRRDLSQGVPVQQVFTASLIVPDLLLRAHEHAPDPAFVTEALRYTTGFIDFEAQVLLPRELERNAHAVANRAAVLARLWRHVRQSPHYTPEAGRTIHLHARRLGALLAKPSTFIASTNHGVMQNIGLLQLATAFPALPEAADWQRLARTRLQLQLDGWIGPDGAVLEHSAGYHFHGVVLSGYVVALLAAAAEPPMPEWNAAHERALAFMQDLQRPDRTLPPYGNTYRYAWHLPPALRIDEASWEARIRDRPSFTRLLPASGHAVWWQAQSAAGVATHTHVPWGYFAGHGHRRAQELSLLVWADGTEWSSNSGYWPNEDTAGVDITNGWIGGNSPHVIGEAADASRYSSVLAHADAEGLRFIDLMRSSPPRAPDGLRIRRQVLQWQGSTWLAVDTYTDPQQRELQVLWTAAPESTARPLAGRGFAFEREGSRVALQLTVEGSAGLRVTPLRGSHAPFGGWVAHDRRAAAAPAVDARLPSPSGWMLTTLHLHPANSLPGNSRMRAVMNEYRGEDRWTLTLISEASGAGTRIRRDGYRLEVSEAGVANDAAHAVRSLQLARGEDPDAELAHIRQSRAVLLEAYPRYATNEWGRSRNSLRLAAVWAVTSAGIWLWPAVLRRLRTWRQR